jgi:hypothetical protein
MAMRRRRQRSQTRQATSVSDVSEFVGVIDGLWFAVQKPPIEQRAGVVWVFDPSEDDHVEQSSATSPFTGERTRVFQPKHIARRIIAQSGWFTVHKYLRERRGFVPLERQSRYQAALTKIIVPPEAFAAIRYGLAQCGVNAASLLTDLTGICAHIEWRHSLLADEKGKAKEDFVLQRSPQRRRRVSTALGRRTKSRAEGR